MPETFHDSAPLFAALAVARDAVDTVDKDSVNKHFRYRYASSEAVIAEARDALAGSGLSFVPLRSKLDTIGAGISEHGEVIRPTTTLVRTFLLAHACGASLELDAPPWPICPGDGRPLDKALAIAATTQLAYALRDLLLMRRGGDDQDAEPAKGEHAPPALAAPRAQARPAPVERSNDARSMPRPSAAELAATPAPSQVPTPVPAAAPSPPAPSAQPEAKPAAAPGPVASKPILEAPAATPVAPAKTPDEVVFAENEAIAVKLGDALWEPLWEPLCSGDRAEQNRDLGRRVFAVLVGRCGSSDAAIAALKKAGVPTPTTVPTREQLRAAVIAMPALTLEE